MAHHKLMTGFVLLTISILFTVLVFIALVLLIDLEADGSISQPPVFHPDSPICEHIIPESERNTRIITICLDERGWMFNNLGMVTHLNSETELLPVFKRIKGRAVEIGIWRDEFNDKIDLITK